MTFAGPAPVRAGAACAGCTTGRDRRLPVMRMAILQILDDRDLIAGGLRAGDWRAESETIARKPVRGFIWPACASTRGHGKCQD